MQNLNRNNESYSQEKNTKRNICIVSKPNVLHLEEENTSIFVAKINEYFKELRIESSSESMEECEHLIGKVSNVIEALNIALVKPCCRNTYLYIGTPLFLVCTNYESKYTLLGYIDDIFGSIYDPMYSVIMKCNPKESNVNSRVYYFPDHPNTLHVYIEHLVDKVSKRDKYKIRTEKHGNMK